MDFSEGSHKIPIDGSWDLEDLYVFPRAYEQVYFMMYALLEHDDIDAQDRIAYAFQQYPWRGGYSAVNFYNRLKYTLPKKERPQVLSLQYASPGWIELSLIVSVAINAEKIIKLIASCLRETNSVYNEIQTGLQKRKLLRIEVAEKQLELEEKHQDYILNSAVKMAELLNLENVDQMNKKSGSPLKTLKIQLSLYRRIRTLAEYQNKGKTRL